MVWSRTRHEGLCVWEVWSESGIVGATACMGISDSPLSVDPLTICVERELPAFPP
jgi:hypothetical protein